MSAFSTTSTSSGTDCCVTISRANLSVAATPTDSTVASPTGCSSISPPPESFVVVWKTKLLRYYFSSAYQYYSIISGATSRCHSAHSGMDHFALCLVFGRPNLDGLGTTSPQYSFSRINSFPELFHRRRRLQQQLVQRKCPNETRFDCYDRTKPKTSLRRNRSLQRLVLFLICHRRYY
jgi:hypothetical protein